MVVATENKAVAVHQGNGRSLTEIMASECNLSPRVFVNTVKAMCFKDGKATDEQLAAFLVVANRYKLDPLIKQIFAFPTQGGGIQPILSIDGWIALANRFPELDGMEHEYERDGDGKLISVECRLYRKDRAHPMCAREYLAECKRATDPWNKNPTRMLRHKATIQAIRYAFGAGGLGDPDDFDEPMDVTGPSGFIRDENAFSGKPAMPQPRQIERADEESQAAADEQSEMELAEKK